MNRIESGMLLIAEPFLKDPNFQRTVVLLCEHETTGSFGITINRVLDEKVTNFLEGIGNHELPLFEGGPVGLDQLHFLHRLPFQIPGGKKIAENIFWGGDLDAAKYLINSGKVGNDAIRFFIGYAGWESGQLKQEMKEKSWLTVQATEEIVFLNDARSMWKAAVKALGDGYIEMINYPLDPSFN
jgi:putative transcriptional regulator